MTSTYLSVCLYASIVLRSYTLGASHTADHARITHKSRTYWVCACLCVEKLFWGVGDRNHWRITHEPRTYHLQSLTKHWHNAHVDAYEKIRCITPRTLDARPTHDSLKERIQTRMLRKRQWNEVIRALFNRDMKVGFQKTDVGVRGFEPVLTHKHWRLTRVPGIVTHTRHIHYARRLMNNAHRRTDVRRIFLNRSKLKTTHKPPSTHIYMYLQSMTVHVRSTDEIRMRRTLRAETKICS